MFSVFKMSGCLLASRVRNRIILSPEVKQVQVKLNLELHKRMTRQLQEELTSRVEVWKKELEERLIKIQVGVGE